MNQLLLFYLASLGANVILFSLGLRYFALRRHRR
jgi:hypothetical protein